MKVNVGKINDLEDGKGKAIDTNGKTIAIFKKDGKFYAIDNTCPHKGGPLGEGILENTTVICPWHGWQFDVSSGKSKIMPDMGVKNYKVEIKGDDVFVELED